MNQSLRKANPIQETICGFAPATIANVNVGFDVLGISLSSVGDRVEVTLNGSGENKITFIESATPLPYAAEKNSCTVVISAMQAQLENPLYVDVRIRKGFASGSGLGSSSASSAAAAFAYNTLMGNPFTLEELLPFAAEGERAACGSAHYDNVSPAILGGIVLLYQNKPIRLPLPKGLHAVSFFPNIEVNTASARSIVSRHVSLDIVSKQVSAMGAFVSGLYQEDYELLRKAAKDFLVEPSRKILIPYFDEMKEATLSVGGITFGISGSGPSVFALAESRTIAERILTELHKIYAGQGIEMLSFIEDLANGKGCRLSQFDE